MDATNLSRTYAVVFLVAAALGVGFICYRVLTPFLAAIAWAIILAVAFQAPWNYLERKMPKRRSLAAIVLTLVIALIVILPAGLFAGVLASQAIDVANRVATKLNELKVGSFSDFVAGPAFHPRTFRNWPRVS
jgi:predicted PurR-regulated permease PerM